jgi:hypothetical protein
LRKKALEIAKTDFWKAFHMVHGVKDVKTSIGIVAIKIDEEN